MSARPLVCPYCGASLFMNMEDTGRAYLSYRVVESIECDDYCGAVWEPDGTPRVEGKT